MPIRNITTYFRDPSLRYATFGMTPRFMGLGVLGVSDFVATPTPPLQAGNTRHSEWNEVE